MDSIITYLITLLEIYNLLIVARVILSWLVQDPQNKFYALLFKITEPVLGPIRRIMPRMGLDFSPVVAMLLIQLVARLLRNAI